MKELGDAAADALSPMSVLSFPTVKSHLDELAQHRKLIGTTRANTEQCALNAYLCFVPLICYTVLGRNVFRCANLFDITLDLQSGLSEMKIFAFTPGSGNSFIFNTQNYATC